MNGCGFSYCRELTKQLYFTQAKTHTCRHPFSPLIPIRQSLCSLSFNFDNFYFLIAAANITHAPKINWSPVPFPFLTTTQQNNLHLSWWWFNNINVIILKSELGRKNERIIYSKLDKLEISLFIFFIIIIHQR